jgi:hypothetical protein
VTAAPIPLVSAAPATNAGDPATRVRVLSALLEELGITGALTASRRLLDREVELSAQAREAKLQATRRWAEHRERLFRGEVGAQETAQVLIEVGPWLDNGPDGKGAAVGMTAMVEVAREARVRAGAMLEGEADPIYHRLQELAGQVVARTAALPALPKQVWAAGDQASTVAIQAGHDLAWAQLVGEATRFDKIHRAAAILRQSGGLPVMVFPRGCPDGLGHVYRNWEPALEGLAELKRHPGPLRLRFAVERQWRPGLWLPSDHETREVERPRRPFGWLIPSPLRPAG